MQSIMRLYGNQTTLLDQQLKPQQIQGKNQLTGPNNTGGKFQGKSKDGYLAARRNTQQEERAAQNITKNMRNNAANKPSLGKSASENILPSGYSLSQHLVGQRTKAEKPSPLPKKMPNKLQTVEITKPVLRKGKSKPSVQEAGGDRSPTEKGKAALQKKVRITPFLKRVEEKQAKEKTAHVKTMISDCTK